MIAKLVLLHNAPKNKSTNNIFIKYSNAGVAFKC